MVYFFVCMCDKLSTLWDGFQCLACHIGQAVIPSLIDLTLECLGNLSCTSTSG